MRLKTESDAFIVEYTAADASRFTALFGGRVSGAGGFTFVREGERLGPIDSTSGSATHMNGDDWRYFASEVRAWAQYKRDKAAGRPTAHVPRGSFVMLLLGGLNSARRGRPAPRKPPARKKAARKPAKKAAARKKASARKPPSRRPAARARTAARRASR